jgi:NAD(P)-dependent dehydrogenase (short-subunit alcohol dehydrogenase family)
VRKIWSEPQSAATAIAFGRAGAISGRDQTRDEVTCEAVRSGEGKATLLLANLADHAAVARLARLALEADARIDVLANAAGAGFFKPCTGFRGCLRVPDLHEGIALKVRLDGVENLSHEDTQGVGAVVSERAAKNPRMELSNVIN